ncbi:hypothetical protein ACFYZB_04295 [Streptomyces sp. NPDC001852]|uniref:hypothetical protein n=1 Tax=Streptomyces sp. NPDC001852 TaxID=3364619 RepID=UPI0036C318D5
MKWILTGALLALLIVYPSLVTLLASALVWLLGKPVLVAFVVGITAGLRLPWLRRWAR